MSDLNTTNLDEFFRGVITHGMAVYSHIWWEDLGYSAPEWAWDLKKCGLPEGVLGWAVKQPESKMMETLEVLQEYAFCLIRDGNLYEDGFDNSPTHALFIIREMMKDIRDAEIRDSMDQDSL